MIFAVLKYLNYFRFMNVTRLRIISQLFPFLVYNPKQELGNIRL